MADHSILSPPERSTVRWNDEGVQIRPGRPSREELENQRQRYDIDPVSLKVFDWGGDRYMNASDAIASAKRAKSG